MMMMSWKKCQYVVKEYTCDSNISQQTQVTAFQKFAKDVSCCFNRTARRWEDPT